MDLKFKSLHIKRNIDKIKQNKQKKPTEWEKIFSNCIINKWLLEDPLADQLVKNLPAMQETWVQSLGCEVPLKKEMATHSSILAWKIHGQRAPGGLQSVGSQKSRHSHIHTQTYTKIEKVTHRLRESICKSCV